MTPPAPYEKSKFLGSGGSMVARLKLKGIDGRAPPGVRLLGFGLRAASFDGRASVRRSAGTPWNSGVRVTVPPYHRVRGSGTMVRPVARVRFGGMR